MAIEFKRTDFAGHFPEIWRGEATMLPGGFKPTQQLAVGTVLRRGVPIAVDFDTHSAAICKTASVLAGGTTQKVRVPKGHYFSAGDIVTKYNDGSATPSISTIDTSNIDFDVINLSAAYTGLKEGDILVESAKTEGAAKAEPLYTPNSIVGAEKQFDGKGLPTIDAAYEAVVLTPALAAPILPEWLNGYTLKLNPNILFIKQ